MWQRWNSGTKIFEKSDDNGAIWTPLGLDAAIITQGTFDTARIPSLDVAKITSGVFAKSRQHAQTAYKDEANTWTQRQIFPGGGVAPYISGVSGGNLLEFNSTGTGATTWIIYNRTDSSWSLYNGGDRFRVDLSGVLYERGRTVGLGEWSAYSITVANMTTAGGSLSGLTVNNYRFTRIGKEVSVKIWITVTLSGATSDYITIELPVAASASASIQFGPAMGNIGGNWGMFAAWYIPAGDNKVRIYREDLSTDHAVGTLNFSLSFTYEAAA